MKQHIEEIIKKNLPDKFIDEKYGLDKPMQFYNNAIDDIPVSLIADEVLKVIKDEFFKYAKKNGRLVWIRTDEVLHLLSNLSPNKENEIQGSSGGNGYNSPVHIPPTGENGYGKTVGCNCEKCLLIKENENR